MKKAVVYLIGSMLLIVFMIGCKTMDEESGIQAVPNNEITETYQQEQLETENVEEENNPIVEDNEEISDYTEEADIEEDVIINDKDQDLDTEIQE